MPDSTNPRSSFSASFLAEVQEIARLLDAEPVEKVAALLVRVRERSGRLFVLGIGGSAANASHAVNDFRKIADIEAYAPTDNVSELTARVNDEGWAAAFAGWLRVSRLTARDAVLVLSVGGGSIERNVSPNIVAALDYAKSAGATILGIVGRDGGYTARMADACIIIPIVHPDRTTPHTEAFQAIIWHLLVSHPALQRKGTRWESIAKPAMERSFVKSLSDLKIKLFADSADKAQILEAHAHPLVRGFTTNPTLMRTAGVQDYEAFAREILGIIKDRPISFEVFSDDFSEMERQARKIALWGSNVFVKIPVMNTQRQSSLELAKKLSHSGVKINVTAVLTLDQVESAAAAVAGGAPSVISVFAGRIADTGRDPVPLMSTAAKIVSEYSDIELLWASPRELLNIFQADDAGCHIITVPQSILAKLDVVGKNLNDYSLETVQMFHNDACKSGYQL